MPGNSVPLQKRSDDRGRAGTTFMELSATMQAAAGFVLLDVGVLRNDRVLHANARHYAVRYDYYLSKRSILYTRVVKVRNDAHAAVTINGAASAGLAPTPGDSPRAVALGMRHVF